MENWQYFYKLLEEEPKFKMMQLKGNVILNDMIYLYNVRIKEIKIRYVKVNESTYLIIFQIKPNQVDEGYIEIGLTISPKEIKSNAYVIDLPQFPDVEKFYFELEIEPVWWHETDLKDIFYIDEKKRRYDSTQKYKCIYFYYFLNFQKENLKT